MVSKEVLCFKRFGWLLDISVGTSEVSSCPGSTLGLHESILNQRIRFAEDSREPQPKILSESSNKANGSTNARRQKGSSICS